jgi:NitT/TauT family transport system substrate-binding protein
MADRETPSRRSARYRRLVLALAAGAVVHLAAAGPALAAQPLRPITLVLEWTGLQPQHFGFWIAKERGWYADEGLDVAIKGSGGSVQAMEIVTGGQAQFGNVASSALVEAAGKEDVPLKMVALFGQRDSLSMAYFQSSGIKTPKDLEGRKLGLVPGSMAAILWPSFAKLNGIDIHKVQIIDWDYRSYYGIFGAKRVDVSGNFTLGSTGSWLFRQQGEIVHQFVFSDYLPLLGSGVIARTDLIKRDPGLVRRFVEATTRAWTYLASDPEHAVPEGAAIVHRAYDETPPTSIIAEYAYEMIPERMTSPATTGKPAGWSSPAQWDKMSDLLKTYDPDMKRRPKASDVMTNEFVTQQASKE